MATLLMHRSTQIWASRDETQQTIEIDSSKIHSLTKPVRPLETPVTHEAQIASVDVLVGQQKQASEEEGYEELARILAAANHSRQEKVASANFSARSPEVPQTQEKHVSLDDVASTTLSAGEKEVPSATKLSLPENFGEQRTADALERPSHVPLDIQTNQDELASTFPVEGFGEADLIAAATSIPSLAVVGDTHAGAVFPSIIRDQACPIVGEFAGYGCHLGCKCGLFQHCQSHFYIRDGDAQASPANVGYCTYGYRYSVLFIGLSAVVLLAVSAMIGSTMENGWRLIKSCPTDRCTAKRAALDKRLQKATSFSPEQRAAILDQFCGSKLGVATGTKSKDHLGPCRQPIPGASQVISRAGVDGGVAPAPASQSPAEHCDSHEE